MRRLSVLAFELLALVAGSGACAQTYPNHPIRLIVGTAPGGVQDASARTPNGIIAELYTELHTALQLPKLREFFLAAGYEPTADPSAQFQKTFQADIKRWGEIAQLAKVQPE